MTQPPPHGRAVSDAELKRSTFIHCRTCVEAKRRDRRFDTGRLELAIVPGVGLYVGCYKHGHVATLTADELRAMIEGADG